MKSSSADLNFIKAFLNLERHLMQIDLALSLVEAGGQHTCPDRPPGHVTARITWRKSLRSKEHTRHLSGQEVCVCVCARACTSYKCCEVLQGRGVRKERHREEKQLMD